LSTSNELQNSFRARRFITPDVIVADDLDHALESCEKAVIALHLA
jgi:hypothetical protein